MAGEMDRDASRGKKSKRRTTSEGAIRSESETTGDIRREGGVNPGTGGVEREAIRGSDVERERELGERDANPDAITGAPGSHPIGTGIGAAGAGAAGAAIGAALGPAGSAVGGVIGAVVGAVAGGLAGKGAAEALNPTDEEAFWQENYKTRPYYTPGATYDDYSGDYRYGYESTTRHEGKSFDDVEHDLRRDWESRPENRNRTWETSKHAVRDAYHRVADRFRRNPPSE